jgi:LDH2 family malate/lactate/ureidoglycolate dehydrogenase
MSEAAKGANAVGPALVGADTLRSFITEVFVRKAMSAEHARLVADALVWANLRGIDSHGVMRVPRYVEFVDLGYVNPQATIRIKTESPAAVLLDAGRAAGPVAMHYGVQNALRKARMAGVGVAFVRATTHTAALGYFTMQIVEQGMAAIAFAGSWPNMVYHGTRQASASTSPISFAVPGGQHGPVVLDMSTGVISLGKINLAKRLGQPLPEGAAIDAAGNPTTDVSKATVPMPLGGPKGAGLALMIELVGSLIVANPLLAESLEGTEEGKRQRQNAFVLAIDLPRFCDPDYFRAEVDRIVRILKRLPRDPNVDEVLMPGERGARTYAKRSREGIPVPPAVMTELASVAAQLGVPMFGA